MADDDTELEAGDGDSEGGSDKESKKDKQGDDKDVVPKSQFLAALSSAEQKRERELAALRSEFEDKLAKATAKPEETVKPYTRAQLNAAVTAGTCTQDEADRIWDDQVRAEVRAEAATVSTQIVTQAQRKERVDSDIAQYKALEPEVLVEGSEVRNKVAQAYKKFLALGDPQSYATELKALYAALGPIENLRLAKSGRDQHDTHRETGGGGGSGRQAKPFESTLTPREKAHYQKGIDSGRYKDWSEVKAELLHAKPETRRKHGATV